MLPVTQTKLVVKDKNGNWKQRGNCWAAAIASILELQITDVPNFETFFHENTDHEYYGFWSWLTEFWLFQQGYKMEVDTSFKILHKEIEFNEYHDELVSFSKRKELEEEYYLVSGKSNRGVNHVCIFKNGEMVHDPHPSRDGLETLEYFEVIRPLTFEETQTVKWKYKTDVVEMPRRIEVAGQMYETQQTK